MKTEVLSAWGKIIFKGFQIKQGFYQTGPHTLINSRDFLEQWQI